MLKPTSFRLAPATLARIKALARPGESSASVVARALEALEAAQDGSAAPPPGSALAQRLTALEARLTALESAVTSNQPKVTCNLKVSYK